MIVNRYIVAVLRKKLGAACADSARRARNEYSFFHLHFLRRYGSAIFNQHFHDFADEHFVVVFIFIIGIERLVDKAGG